jgi:hypothetical protein
VVVAGIAAHALNVVAVGAVQGHRAETLQHQLAQPGLSHDSGPTTANRNHSSSGVSSVPSSSTARLRQ